MALIQTAANDEFSFAGRNFVKETSSPLDLEKKRQLQVAPTTPLGIAAAPDSLASLAAGPDPLYRLLLLNLVFTEIQCKETDLFEKQIQRNKQTHALLAEKQKVLVQAQAEDAQTLTVWKTVQDVGAYSSYAASAVIGVGFCASPVGATALVASAAIGCGSKIMSDTGGWRWVVSYFASDADKKTRQKYTAYIENAATITSIGASLVGGIASFSKGALNLTDKYFQPTLISAVTNTVRTVGSVGKELTEASYQRTEAGLKEVEQDKTELFADLGLQNEHTAGIADFQRATLTSLSSMLEQHFMYV